MIRARRVNARRRATATARSATAGTRLTSIATATPCGQPDATNASVPSTTKPHASHAIGITTCDRADPTASTASPTHPCSSCAAPISDRYPFPDCTRCAMVANANNPDVVAWRQNKRAEARERIANMKAKQEAHENE